MFGIQTQDILMQQKIAAAGFTVEEAAELRRQGKLPEDLAEVWDKYDAWLKDFCGESGK